MTNKPKPKSTLHNISTYVPGSHSGSGSDDPVVVLSANENAYGTSPKAVQAMQDATKQVFRYQDGSATELIEAIARVHGIDKERIVCGNGSDEILGLVIQAFTHEGDEVLYSEHGFLIYGIASHATGAKPVTVPENNGTICVDRLLAGVTHKTKMIMVTNPANPTGTMVVKSEIERLIQSVPSHILIVLDSAYAEYVDGNPDYDNGIHFVNRYDNVLMTRTFSKMYGLAGIRVGWAYASAEIIDYIHRVRAPFNVNMIAQAGAVAALNDQDFIVDCREKTLKTLTKFVADLQDLGIECLPSYTNFVLANMGTAERANGVYEYLKSKNVLVRAMGGYGFPDRLRITVGTDDEMAICLKHLTDFVKKETKAWQPKPQYLRH